MKVTVRRFRKITLKKYQNVQQNPLCAISPKNKQMLKIDSDSIKVNNFPVRLIDGSSEKFIGMTKTLRENLGVENGQVVEINFENSILKVK